MKLTNISSCVKLTIYSLSVPSPQSSNSATIGSTVAGAVAGVCIILLVVIVFVVVRHKKKKKFV